jgi:hypothetical protein
MNNINNVRIEWQCTCGTRFASDVEKHEDCLPYLINGRSLKYVVSYDYTPDYPVTYVTVNTNI